MRIPKMSDLDLKGKRVLIREDFNVPLKNGEITSDLRIRAALPTIQQAMKAGAKVMLMSHLGRPNEGGSSESFTLAPVAAALSKLLKVEVPLITHWIDGFNMGDNQVVLLENVRFNQGETTNSAELCKKMPPSVMCMSWMRLPLPTAWKPLPTASSSMRKKPAQAR